MRRPVIWHGTGDEALALLGALQTNCTCRGNPTGHIVSPCAGHFMLAHDQRAIDGLLFMRRLAARLLQEEFHPEHSVKLF